MTATRTDAKPPSGTDWQLPPRPSTRLRTALIIGAVAAFTIATCLPAIGGVQLDFGALVSHWDNGSGLLLQLFQPDFAFLRRTVQPML